MQFDICGLLKEKSLKELVMRRTDKKRPVWAHIQKTFLARNCAKHWCLQTCYGPFATVPETDSPPLSERKQGQKGLKIQIWMQKKNKVTVAESTHVSLRCPQMCVPCYTGWSLHPCSCNSNQRFLLGSTKLTENFIPGSERKYTHLLPFCWRILFACSGSMCTSLVTKECPSPWLKGRGIKSEFDLRLVAVG